MPTPATNTKTATDKLDGNLFELHTANRLSGDILSVIVRYETGAHERVVQKLSRIGAVIERDIPRLRTIVVSIAGRDVLQVASLAEIRDVGQEGQYVVA